MTKPRAKTNGLGGAASTDGVISPARVCCQRLSQEIVVYRRIYLKARGLLGFSGQTPYLSHNVPTFWLKDMQCFAVRKVAPA